MHRDTSETFDVTAKLVAQDPRLVDVEEAACREQIGAAQSGQLDVDQDLTRAWHGIGHARESGSTSFPDDGTHPANLAAAT